MIRKLIISAVVLTALISVKEANAAGAAGFARSLAATLPQTEVAELAPVRQEPALFTAEKRQDVIRVSGAVEEALRNVDAYFDMFADDDAKAVAPQGCFDCADIKRDQLIGLGWSADEMRIAYAISREGRIERVLVIETALGDLVVGGGRPTFAEQLAEPEFAMPSDMASDYDI
jgi:predicted transglutaminase-like cysteine proteinase